MYSRWWAQLQGNDDGTLSILDLINSGTIDCKLAALLWSLMENRASVTVAAGPSFAGKTTLLHALLDLLPPKLKKIPLKGYYEDFQFLKSNYPEYSYLVAEEISNHGLEEYLWGIQVLKVFKLLSQGYALGTTIHARNSEEVIYLLRRVLGIPFPYISNMGIIVNLHVTAVGNYFENDLVRRVKSVDLILPHQEGLAIQVLAAQNTSEKGFDYLTERNLQQALAKKNLIGNTNISIEVDSKKRLLKHLLKQGKKSRKEFRKIIQEYYSKSKHCVS
jgi:hypothetical protein